MPITISYENKNYDLLVKADISKLKKDIATTIKDEDFFYLKEIKRQLNKQIERKTVTLETQKILDILLSKIDDFFDEENDTLSENQLLFPRSEYYTRFKLTTAFNMKNPAYWGTYHRSESTRFFKEAGGRKNVQFLSPCVKKPAKANSFFAHTGGISSPFENEKYQEAVQLSILAPKSKVNFRDMALIYKTEMAKIVVNSFSVEMENEQKLKIKKDRNTYLRPIVFQENDYPCVLISLPSLNPVETKTKAAKYWSKHPKPFQKLLLASFVAILNIEAREAKLPIEMVIRASFGHNLPSICETENTFRINVGIIPKCYAKLIGKALIKLNKVINQLEDECDTEPPFNNDFHTKVRTYNAKKLKKAIDEKNLYKSLRNIRNYQKAENSNEAFESLYKKFITLNKGKSKGEKYARFTPIRLQGESVWEVIYEAGDSGGKSILAECFREHETVDLFADMVINAIDEDSDQNPIEKALYDLLGYFNIVEDTVTMNYKKMHRDLKSSLKYSFDQNSFEDCYKNDMPFNKITQLLFDGLGSERPNNNLYSAIEKAGVKFFNHVKGSETLEEEPDYGSDSDFSVDNGSTDSDSDTEKASVIPFSHSKLRVCSGMKAIILAHYGALCYLRKKNGAKQFQLDIKQMYYEVEKALVMVKDCKPVINNIRGKLEKFAILHFDLNHCNASNAPNNDVTLENKLDDLKPTVVILDYTSSTSAHIQEAITSCLSDENIQLLILVESGLKNDQAGLDFNPYGEVRVIARERKTLNDVLDEMKLGLAEKDKIPQHTNELVRACKNRGFAPSLFGLFKTEEERFQVVYKTSLFHKKK